MALSASRARSRLERREHELIGRIPVNGEIFLPTEAVPLEQRVRGLERVSDLYDSGFETDHAPRLEALRRRWQGEERCFVLGNGPSLKDTDLDLLTDEVTFATNGIFLLFDETDWRPTFYVVEDHLVAEDRQREINALTGFTRLYPINLAYVLQEQDETIFFDHRPRPSFPRGFDFSTDARTCTYAGCTVTFTCLQLAYYFGFQHIYLVGVDCDYAIPDDASSTADYGVKVLDMDVDDPNHFHPDYFGKGKRWHDPQVDKMLEAYDEARQVTSSQGVAIVNATKGGKLDVFPRVEYDRLFDDPAPAVQTAVPKEIEGVGQLAPTGAPASFPKLLVVDPTRIGGATATGEVKRQLLRGWPVDRLLQVSAEGGRRAGLSSGRGEMPVPLRDEDVIDLCRRFEPDLIYVRPLDRPKTHRRVATTLLDALTDVPFVVHIMDDWPARASERSWIGRDVEAMLTDLFERAQARFSISRSMSEAFEQRYGLSFDPFANCVDVSEWPVPTGEEGSRATCIFRYAGSLAEDMTLRSLLDFAETIESVANEAIPAHFEISTSETWARAASAFGHLEHTSVSIGTLPVEAYRSWIRAADVNVIAYNFDEETIRYVRYSLANKLPEYLAAGRAVVAYGAPGLATIERCRPIAGTTVVDRPDRESLRAAIERLASDVALRRPMGRLNYEEALSNFDARTIRSAFQDSLRQAAASGGWSGHGGGIRVQELLEQAEVRRPRSLPMALRRSLRFLTRILYR